VNSGSRHETAHILVLRPGALGDTLLAVPALRALRRRFGEVTLTLAAQPAAARFLEQVGEVDRGLAFDDPALTHLFGAATTHPDDVDGTIIVAWVTNTAALPALRVARVVAPGRPGDARHCATYLLETLVPLGVDSYLDDAPLRVPPLMSDEVLVHPGSGSGAKNWPAERFAAVIQRLVGPVRLIVGEADAAAADAVEMAIGAPLPRLEQPPLVELAGRLAGCRTYLGNDSGVSHLAGLSGARTLAVFGPTSPEVWRPIGPRITILNFVSDPTEVAGLLNR
jgi:ADP-heptose:LPS heptosyltransferase